MTRRAKEQRQKRLEKKRAGDSPEEIERRNKWNLLLQQIDTPQRPRALSAPSILNWNSSHAVVGAAGKFELPVRVEYNAAELSYTFDTKEMDIYFSVTFVDAATGQESFIVEPTRCASHENKVRGNHDIQGPGNLKLTWDNEYSWINSKQLSYHVNLAQKDVVPTTKNGLSLLDSEIQKRQRLYRSMNTTYENLVENSAKRADTIKSIENQIEELKLLLETEQNLQLEEANEIENAGREVDMLAAELSALSWRTLPRSSISHILSYCTTDDQIRWLTLNKQWHELLCELHNQVPDAPNLRAS